MANEVHLTSENDGDASEAPGRFWVVVARSCNDCNEIALQLFTAAPTDDQKLALWELIGGMWCVRLQTFALAADGEPVRQRLCEDLRADPDGQ
jgi:hypothetical protein